MLNRQGRADIDSIFGWRAFRVRLGGMQTHLSFAVGAALVLGVGISGCGPSPENASTAPAKTPAAATNAGSMLTAPVDYIAGSIQAGEKSKETIDLIVLRKAIESFQQEEGRNPSSLEELVQKTYLRGMPKPPAGRKFDYDASSGQVRLVPRS